MSQMAKLIVRARCVANSPAWDAGEIWTFTTFAIQDTWKGVRPGVASQLTVRLLGGSVGSLSSTVSGVPRFHPGEEVILFLEPTARGDFSVVSWIPGTFRIRHDRRTGEEIVVQDSAAFDTFNPATRQFDSAGGRGHRRGSRRHTQWLELRRRKSAHAFRRIVRPRAPADRPQLQPLRRAAGRPRTPRRFQRRSGRLMPPNASPSCQTPAVNTNFNVRILPSSQ